MPNITYLVIGLVIGYILGKRKVGPSVDSGQDSTLITEQAEEKKRNFEKVMAYFDQNRQATNDQIQQLLGVSDATAERYLQEMEVWGKIKQVGRTGKQVTYEKI